MKELADLVVGNAVNPRLLLQQKGWQVDLMALLALMRSRLSPPSPPTATTTATATATTTPTGTSSSGAQGKGPQAANGWSGARKGGRGSEGEVGEEELEEAEVVWEQVRRLLLATHAHALQHSSTGWQHVADTVGALRMFAQQGKLPYHLVLRPLLAELITVQSGLSSRGNAARNNCLFLFALIDEFALHDSRHIFPAKELMTAGVGEAVDGLAGITTPRSHAPHAAHAPSTPLSPPHSSSPPLWHTSGGALWGEGRQSRGRGGMGEGRGNGEMEGSWRNGGNGGRAGLGRLTWAHAPMGSMRWGAHRAVVGAWDEGDEGDEGEEEGMGGRAGQGGQRGSGGLYGGDGAMRPLTPPGLAVPLTPPGMSPLGGADRGFLTPTAAGAQEGSGAERFSTMSLDVEGARSPGEADLLTTSVDLVDCSVDLGDSSGAGEGGASMEGGVAARVVEGQLVAVGAEGEEQAREGGGRAEEDKRSHLWDQLLQADDSEFRWKAYDGFWALLALLHNKADAAAALSAGLFRSLPRSASTTALPLSRLRALAPPSPSRTDLDAALEGDGGGHWGCSTEERLEQLGKEKCPRVVFRLVLLYVYDAELDALQRCLHHFTVLVPVMLADGSDGNSDWHRNRFHLFLWSLLHAHEAVGHMEEGARGEVIAQGVHDVVVSAAAVFAQPMKGSMRATPSSSGSEEDDDLEAARHLVQQQRVDAAVEEEIGHMLSAVAQWDAELSHARQAHEALRAQRVRQQRAFQELQRIALADLLHADSRRRAAARIAYDEQQERVKAVWEQLYREMTSERGPWYSPPSPSASSSSLSALSPGATPPVSAAVQRWKLDKSEDAQRRRFRLRPHLRFDDAMCRPALDASKPAGREGGAGEEGGEIRVEKDLLEEVAMLQEEHKSAQEGAAGAGGTGAGAGGGGEVAVRSSGVQLGLRFESDDEVITSLPCIMVTAKRKLGGRMELRRRSQHFFADFVFEGTAGSSLFDQDGRLRPPHSVRGEAERGGAKVGPRERWRRVTQRLLLVAKLQPTEKTLGRASVRMAKDPDVLEEVKMHRQWPLHEVRWLFSGQWPLHEVSWLCSMLHVCAIVIVS
ncbi:unnamed protein product [Closterium sp. Naga37s-1]|nr:unnamed protein product [Closterium sp. Naga37s-1]